MLSTIVKISAVTNLSDARYCAGMGVEMLGFTLDKTDENYVSPEKYQEIRSWVAGVQFVGETQTEDFEEIREIVETYNPDCLQVTIPEMLPMLVSEFDIPLLLRLDADRISPPALSHYVSTYGKYVTYLLLESSLNSPLQEEWQNAISTLTEATQLLLGFGWENRQQLHQFLEKLPIAGIALKGSEELRPGYTDYGELMDILESLETE